VRIESGPAGIKELLSTPELYGGCSGAGCHPFRTTEKGTMWKHRFTREWKWGTSHPRQSRDRTPWEDAGLMDFGEEALEPKG
jgi:hypothetical protein